MAIDVLVAFAFQDGVAFPDSGAADVSAPGAQDGTEFFVTMINNYMFGPQQMLLDHAGLTPTGVIESATTSQVKEALQKGFGAPPGVPTEWHLASDPGVTGHRALLLNGQGILRANYPDLDAAVYVGDGNNAAVAAAGGAYFRADNSDGTSPNIAGVYLILPERRGYVPRGLDTAASVDPDGASRVLGDVQLDAFQGHIFNNGIGYTSAVFWIYGGTASEVPGSATDRITGDSTNPTQQGLTSAPKTDGVNGTPRISSESRMVNSSTKWVVWY